MNVKFIFSVAIFEFETLSENALQTTLAKNSTSSLKLPFLHKISDIFTIAPKIPNFS